MSFQNIHDFNIIIKNHPEESTDIRAVINSSCAKFRLLFEVMINRIIVEGITTAPLITNQNITNVLPPIDQSDSLLIKYSSIRKENKAS